MKQSFRRKSEDIRRPLIPGENIDEVYRQKERERKRKKLEEQKQKIIPVRASNSQINHMQDNSNVKYRLYIIISVTLFSPSILFLKKTQHHRERRSRGQD